MKKGGRKPEVGDLVRFYLGIERVELMGVVDCVKFDSHFSHLPDTYEVIVVYESACSDVGYTRIGRKLGMFLSELTEIIEEHTN